jgi:23S rRNA (adenine2503-C2)-methyltransferase
MPATIDLTDPSARPARPQPAKAPSPAMDGKPTLIGMSREEMVAAMADAGVPEKQRKMRVNQIWHWLYVRGSSDFADMHTISRELRETLAARYTVARPEIVEEQISNDGTRKWLMRFPPRGAGRPVEVETVYIPEEGRGTLCISSQVGCTLTCTFCHTGTQKLVRNLTAEEILSQLAGRPRSARRFPAQGHAAGRDRACRRPQGHQHRDDGYGRTALQLRQCQAGAADCLGRRRPGALEAAASRCRPPAWCRASSAPATKSASCWRFRCTPCVTSCATSWCRSTRSIRSKNCSTRAALIPACRTRGASPFEYVMLKGVNDSLADAKELVTAAQGHSGQDQSDPVQ